MKAYIQTNDKGDFLNVNSFLANEGFTALGWQTCRYHSIENIDDLDPETIVVGGIGMVRKRLLQLGMNTPQKEIDYPEELQKYLGRKIWSSTVEELIEQPNNWNVFIKPRDITKQFPGKVVRDFKDFIGLGTNENGTAIWCSEVVDFVAEWRCFIRYKEIFDVRQYRGRWDSRLDLSVVKNAVNDFTSAPAAYALDMGIDSNGEYKLVEVNDGHSIGSYGMGSMSYAKFLSARWAQMTNTKDYLLF